MTSLTSVADFAALCGGTGVKSTVAGPDRPIRGCEPPVAADSAGLRGARA
jgi:hypothetical protein